MFILPAVIIIEIFSIFVIPNASSDSFSNFKYGINHILPAVFAEDASNSATPEQSSPQPASDQTPSTPSDTTPPADNLQPTVQPSDTSLPNPTESPQGNPSDTTPSSPEPSATESPTQESQSSPNETNNPQTNQQSGSASESNGTTPVVLDETQEQAQTASQTVISGGDMISGPLENIDKNVEQMSNAQDQKLEEAKTPDEKATLSVGFAQDSVKAAEQSLKNDDLQTATYVVQRISDQIDTAVLNAQSSTGSKPLQELSSFCKQADFAFRTQQLAVPEEAVQDFEIVRGKCLNVNQ